MDALGQFIVKCIKCWFALLCALLVLAGMLIGCSQLEQYIENRPDYTLRHKGDKASQALDVRMHIRDDLKILNVGVCDVFPKGIIPTYPRNLIKRSNADVCVFQDYPLDEVITAYHTKKPLTYTSYARGFDSFIMDWYPSSLLTLEYLLNE